MAFLLIFSIKKVLIPRGEGGQKAYKNAYVIDEWALVLCLFS